MGSFASHLPRRTVPQVKEVQKNGRIFLTNRKLRQLFEGLRMRVGKAAPKLSFCRHAIAKHMEDQVDDYIDDKDKQTCLKWLPVVIKHVLPTAKKKSDKRKAKKI